MCSLARVWRNEMPPAQAQTKPRPKTGSRKTRDRASSPRLRLPTGRPQGWVQSRLPVQLSVNRPAMPRAQPQAAASGPQRSASRVVAGVGRAKASSPRPAALAASTHRASKIRNMGTLRHSDRQSTRCGPAGGRDRICEDFSGGMAALLPWRRAVSMPDGQTDSLSVKGCGCAAVTAATAALCRSPGRRGAHIFGAGAAPCTGKRRGGPFRAGFVRPGPCGSGRRNRRWSFADLLPAAPWVPSPAPRGPG